MPPMASTRDGVLNVQWTEFTRQFLKKSEYCMNIGKARALEPVIHPWDPQDQISGCSHRDLVQQRSIVQKLRERIAALKGRQPQGAESSPRQTSPVRVMAPWDKKETVPKEGDRTTGFGRKAHNRATLPVVPRAHRSKSKTVRPPFGVEGGLSDKEHMGSSVTTLSYSGDLSIEQELTQLKAKLEIAIRKMRSLEARTHTDNSIVPPKTGHEKLGEHYAAHVAPWDVVNKRKQTNKRLMDPRDRPGAADTGRITGRGKDGSDPWENLKPRTPKYPWVNF